MSWIEQVLRAPGFSLFAFPAALLLGFLTAVISCCNFGIIAAIAGYTGSRHEALRRREVLSMSLFFLIGSIIALFTLGLFIGHFSGLLGEGLRRYGTLILGFVVIVAGLFALGLVPFRLPSFDMTKVKRLSRHLGPATFGLAVGAASITCTLACCSPLFAVVLGLVVARGQAIWGALILASFALGYGFPLSALMLGLGLGRTTSLAQKILKPIRIVSGAALIGAGFWLLATM
jgi:cytochrome c biogenesis protein CcdA